MTVRTPHDATRDCFSISEDTVCSRSMRVLTVATSSESSTSRSGTCAAHACATRRSPRHHDGPLILTAYSGKTRASICSTRVCDSGDDSPHVETMSTSTRRLPGTKTSSCRFPDAASWMYTAMWGAMPPCSIAS